MFTIRRFESTDTEPIIALHRLAMQHSGGFIDNPQWDKDLLEIESHYLARRGEFLVGIAEGAIVAMGALRPHEGDTGEIKRMRVHPDHQRKGYGRAIYGLLEQRARELGYNALILDTGTRQIAAQRFYAMHGFAETGRRQLLPDFEIILYRKSLKGDRMYTADLVTFLEELRVNNNKMWFEANRKHYEGLRGQFTAYVDEIIAKTAAFDATVGALSAKDCLFRVNRDIRFSKDKSPYKTNFAASIAPHAQDHAHLGYYLSIDADGDYMVGGGVHRPEPPVLLKIRTAIAGDGDRLAAIVADPKFAANFGGLEGEQLKTVPRVFPPDHPQADLLRLKSFTAGKTVCATDISDDRFVAFVVDIFRGLSPLLGFLAAAAK